MNRGTALFAVGGLFVAGIVIGVLATLLVAGQAVRPPAGRPGPGAPPPDGMHLDRLARQLELDDGQRARIEAILDDVRIESESLRAELTPRLEALMLETDDRILAELDESQRERFERLRQRHRAMMERFFVGGRGGRGERGRPPGPPPHDGPPRHRPRQGAGRGS